LATLTIKPQKFPKIAIVDVSPSKKTTVKAIKVEINVLEIPTNPNFMN
jgi:hypothetical protein